MAMDMLQPRGYFLYKYSGAYALFVHSDEVYRVMGLRQFPRDEFRCYLGAKIYGNDELPISFAREWAFMNPLDAVFKISN